MEICCGICYGAGDGVAMTESQQHDRTERMGIMIYEGGCTEAEARAYCDAHPATFGILERDERQEDIFGNASHQK